MKKKLVIVSGYFNPIHKGHLEYFEKAKLLGDELLVIVNSDLQRELKKSKKFQDENERLFIVKNFRLVDYALIAVDIDRSVSKTLEQVFHNYNDQYHLIFANGGDQTNSSIPEISKCVELGIELVDGLGDKIQSSSWLLGKV